MYIDLERSVEGTEGIVLSADFVKVESVKLFIEPPE